MDIAVSPNSYGHDKENPTWQRILEERSYGKGYPEYRKKVARAFCRSFYYHPGRYSSVIGVQRNKRSDNSTRMMHSPLRDAICCTVVLLMESIDLLTLRVGIPYTDQFDHMARKIIYKRAKDFGISKTRIDRAMQVLQKSGLASVKRRAEFKLEKDRYEAKCSAIRLSEAFFKKLGGEIYNKLKSIRKYKSDNKDGNSIDRQNHDRILNDQADMELMATALSQRGLGAKPKKKKPPPDPAHNPGDPAYIQKLIDGGLSESMARSIAAKTER